ncbi:serine hydrolase [Streptomyces sp. NPDC001581]|uniref:serine hydrolase n=1 Tax=Streptomyces sp. NPDC001581 TaxID=3154386 RepID=UPI00332EF368
MTKPADPCPPVAPDGCPWQPPARSCHRSPWAPCRPRPSRTRRIARPLGLRHTYLPQAGDASMPTTSLDVPGPKEPWAWAEGGMISNAPGMERFTKALPGGRLLPPAQQSLLFVMPPLSKTSKQPYSAGGLACHKLSDGTDEVIGHVTGIVEAAL